MMESWTLGDRGVALAKLLRYLRAKVRDTGSLSSMTTLFSAESAVVECRMVMFAVPMSPEELNLHPSLVTETVTVSPIDPRSLAILWYSPARVVRVGVRAQEDEGRIRSGLTRGHGDVCAVVLLGHSEVL